MIAPTPHQRLTHISTLWSLVHRAHEGTGSALTEAQRQLLERYAGAAHRYLLGGLRDADAADEMFQEFSLRMLRGDFKNADPHKGRFRDFIKTALFHLIVDYQRRRRDRVQVLDANGLDLADSSSNLMPSDREFLASWREQLMDRTWQGLAGDEQQSGRPHHTILKFRTEHPLLPSAELAEQIGGLLGKAYTIDGIRQSLHRARERFMELLLDEVAQSLENAGDADALEQELMDLDLWTYCRPVLQRRGSK